MPFSTLWTNVIDAKNSFSSYIFQNILSSGHITDYFDPRKEERKRADDFNPKKKINSKIHIEKANSLRQRFESFNVDRNHLRSKIGLKVCISKKFHTSRTAILENSRFNRYDHSKRTSWGTSWCPQPHNPQGPRSPRAGCVSMAMVAFCMRW